MKIAVIVDPELYASFHKAMEKPESGKSESESSEMPHQLQILKEALEEYGNKTQFLTPNIQLLSQLIDGKFDFIVNTTDKISTRFKPAQYVGLFDISQIPYLGSRLDAIGICKNKALFKSILQLNYIATPKFQILKMQSGKFPKIDPKLNYPIIIKIFAEGIHEPDVPDQVAHNQDDIDEILKNISKKRKFTYAMLEEYIHARKFYLPIFGNDLNDDIHFLPAIEYIFPEDWNIEQRIHAKTEDLEYKFLEITNPLVKRARKVAHKAYTFCHCRDFAMAVFLIDDKTDNLLLHEINPITNLLPSGKMALAAEHIGLSYREMINDLILTALKRYDLKLRGKYGKREKVLQKEQEQIDQQKQQEQFDQQKETKNE